MGLLRRKQEEAGREWSASSVAPSAAPLEEEQWIQRARAGEEEAFAWLLARYRPRVVRLAAHVLRRPEEAEDVAQEAFIRAFRKIRAFRGEGHFYTWLYHIVLHVCLDRRRTARWHREVSNPSQDHPASVASPTEAIDMRLLVARLLDNLSPPMRAALVLRELEGLEYEEIAEALEIPVGTVRSRLNAARAQFRGLWRAVMQEADHV